MSAHEIYVTLIGNDLKKYTENKICNIMNKRHHFDWCYESSDICIEDNLITLYMESKNCNIEKVIKNVKQYMPEVVSVRYWCKPYWMNITTNYPDYEMFFWTKNKTLAKECFYDGRMNHARFNVWLSSWLEAWERQYKKYCEDNKIEYIEKKSSSLDEFKEDGIYNNELYHEYLNERYDVLEYEYLCNLEDELYDSFIKKTSPGKNEVTIFIH